jgi:DNA-binding NarL/FixJ family response regulator
MSSAPDYDVVAVVGDPDALRRAVGERRPDVAIVDVRMPSSATCKRKSGRAQSQVGYTGRGAARSVIAPVVRRALCW